MIRIARWGIVFVAALFLSGCAALHDSIAKRDLSMQASPMGSIHLDPMLPEERVTYIQVTDSTGNNLHFEIKNELTSLLQRQGYKVVDDHRKAFLHYSIGVVYAGKASDERFRSTQMAGYQGALTGAAVGIGTGALARSRTGMAAGGLLGMAVGAAAGTIIDAYAKTGNYAIVADIQISQMTNNGHASQTQVASLRQGTGTFQQQQYNSQSQYVKYANRVPFSASKFMLKWEEALPELRRMLVNSLAGSLPA